MHSVARRSLRKTPRSVSVPSVGRGQATTPATPQQSFPPPNAAELTVPQAIIVESYSSPNYVHPPAPVAPFVRTHPLTFAGRFEPKPSTVVLPISVQRATSKDLKHHSSNAHFIEVLNKVQASTPKKGLPLPKPLDVPPARPSPWVAALLPVQYARSLTVCTETVRRLGTDWVGDVKTVLDIGSDGAGLLAWKSIAMSVDKGELDRGKNGLLRGLEKEDSRSKKANSYEEMLYEEDNADLYADEEPASKDVESFREKALKEDLEGGIEVKDFTEALEAGKLEEVLEGVTEPPFEEVAEGSASEAHHDIPEAVEATEADIEEPEPEYEPTEEELYEVKFEGSLVTKSPTSAYTVKRHIPTTKILDKIPEEASPKRFDLIIAHDILVPHMHDPVRLKQRVIRLHQMLSPNGVLVLIGEGSSRGFLAMNSARDALINRKKKPTPPGESEEYVDPETQTEEDAAKQVINPLSRIIAPCTNQERCPMADSRLSRKGNNCLFTTRYQYPNYIQRILPPTMSRYNYEDTAFSYLVTTPFASEQQPSLHDYPRLINRPLKRSKHVILDLCTSQGKIERWTVPKSHGRPEYHDARKTRWGDIWCLGAKTKKARTMKMKKSARDRSKPKLSEKEKQELEFLEPDYEERKTKKLISEMIQ